jgi:hypothetical protein
MHRIRENDEKSVLPEFKSSAIYTIEVKGEFASGSDLLPRRH